MSDALRFVTLDGYRVGIVDGADIVDVTDVFADWTPTAAGINAVIASFTANEARVREQVASGPRTPRSAARLLPPVPRPTNLLCAPVNYRTHKGEVTMDRTGEASASADARQRGFFLKSAASISGPQDPVLLPELPGRTFAYEGEVAVVISRAAKAVAAADAWDYVFGLSGFVDVTLRPGDDIVEERSMRKSYATFGPLGPEVLVTSDPAIAEQVDLELRLNGEVRQSAPLTDLLVDIPTLIEMTSHVHPLEPGDVIATGTPGGVGAIEPGDEIELTVRPVGTMTLQVAQRDW